MTQEHYPFTDLDFLLSKNDIREEDLLQLPDLIFEEAKNSSIKTLLTHEPENLVITSTNKPTVTLNDRAKKRKSTFPSR